MADEKKKEDGKAEDAAGTVADEVNSAPEGLAGNWQLPALLTSTILFGLALWSVLPEPAQNDFPGAMNDVQEHLDANKLEYAKKRLDDIAPHMHLGTQKDLARFKLLNGDLIFKSQRIHQTNNLTKHAQTADLYTEARELGWDLDGLHRQHLAETYVALGEDAKAMQIVDSLMDDSAERRYRVIRQIIERRRDAEDDPLKYMSLVDRFLDEVKKETDLTKRDPELLWGLELKLRVQLESGDLAGVIDEGLKKIMRLRSEGMEKQLGAIQVVLGTAYYNGGQLDQAERMYLSAQKKLDDGDPHIAETLIGLAQIILDVDRDYEKALGLFSQVYLNYPASEFFLDATIGKGICEARRGIHPEAIKNFMEATRQMKNEKKRKQKIALKKLDEIAQTEINNLRDRADYDKALDYFRVMDALYPDGFSPELLRLFASTHQALAQNHLNRVNDLDKEEARKLANQKAWEHFKLAGESYLNHSLLVLTKNSELAKESLWSAAQNYDKANSWKKAIDIYARYQDASEPDDPKHVESKARIALAHLSTGQYKEAMALFQALDRDYPASQVTHDIYLAMARTHWLMQKPKEAITLLNRIVNNHPQIRPNSELFKKALVMLGQFHYRHKQYAPAIDRLDQAMQRYSVDDEFAEVRYTLGDAYRLSIAELDQAMEKANLETDKLGLQAEKSRRLSLAFHLFDEVVQLLKEKDNLKALHDQHLRNSYLYRADCAYDLEEYQEAIRLYDQAANRWNHDPTSLVALIQIVNANCQIGNVPAAKVANRRAQEQLKRMPDEAFQDESLPMKREHWESWLKWSEELNLFASTKGETLSAPKKAEGDDLANGV